MLTKRSIVSCIILTLITCGLYSIYWWICLNNDFAKENNESANGLMVVILTIITCGIYGLIWCYKMGKNIEKAGGKDDGVMYLVLFLLGFGVISFALMQAQENELCEKNSLNQ